MCQLPFYDLSKYNLVYYLGLKPTSVWTHCLASLGATIPLVLVMNPFDVAATRVYNQQQILTQQVSSRPLNISGKLYSGPVECLKKTWQMEGVRGMYKGMGMNYLRNVPHAVLKFVFLEQFRQFLTS